LWAVAATISTIIANVKKSLGSKHEGIVVRTGSGARFWWILSLAIILLILVIFSAFTLGSPWSWLVGLTYVAYESWLTGHLFLSSRRAIIDSGPIKQDQILSIDDQRHYKKLTEPIISVLIAARNERRGLPATLAALHQQLNIGDTIIVIDDGSTDDTLSWITTEYSINWQGDKGRSVSHPYLHVLRQENRGKARSLNRALDQTSADIVVTLDADTIAGPGAIAAVRKTFYGTDVVAACGVLTPICLYGWSAWIFGLFQKLEYGRSYIWRMGWTREQTLVLVSGAFAAFRRSAIIAVGGFDPTSKVEDYELLFRLNRAAANQGNQCRVVVMPEARAMTDVPGTVCQFLRQRARWFAGFIETMVRHRDLVGDARCGRLGTVHLVIKTIDLLLPLYGLLAVIVLLVFLLNGGDIHPAIVWVLLSKLAYDLGVHWWSMSLHRWWQGGQGVTLVTVIATICEPLLFQPLRQLGAALGWIAFFRGHIDWSPQRPVEKST
jgi:cellulose synthase/poly-beta-1,6-N-acetylglucosamine synthase-like glycosyltransferase